MIILIILIILVLLSFLFINKTLKNKNTKLDDVKLQDSTIENNKFALMLQQDDGTYKESNTNSWPTNMIFNSELSGCIDTNGNKIDDSLSYDSNNNLITVSTSQTSYCYVYFDIDKTLTKYLINTVSNKVLWNSSLEDDGYRYVGTNPDNYICFGTSDKDTCINDTDKYMYRIIGIFEDSSGTKHAKLIKKEALNTTYAWNSSYSSDVDWNNSDLYKGINGSYFLTNTSYSYMQDTSWTNKISAWNYTMVNTLTYSSAYGTSYYYTPAKVVYLHELNRSSKINQTCYYNASTSGSGYCSKGTWKNLNTKISIMYASDYQLSLGTNALNYISSSNASALKTGWIHLSNNDTNAPNDYEWTMSLYGGNAYSHSGAWNIYTSGEIQRHYVENVVSVRPVFYLESNVVLADNFGNGTITNPYLIN